MKLNARVVIHESFQISIFLKGMFALAEIVGAGLVFFFKPDRLVTLIYKVTAKEYYFDPHDWISNQLIDFAQSYSVHAQMFGFLYLLSHGIIKIFLVVNLWRRKLWAYPLALVVFILFIVYQIYRYSFTHSTTLIWLSGLDLVVIVLTLLEYNQIKKHSDMM